MADAKAEARGGAVILVPAEGMGRGDDALGGKLLGSVGQVSNMREITQRTLAAGKVITL